jgi:hypothetical protein
MEALRAADILALWERGSGVSVHERALLLLGAARPDLPPARLGAVPLGARDAELLRLRRATFGERLAATIACPACGEELELEVGADAIQPAVDADTAYSPIRVKAAGREVRIRPPTTDDLMDAVAAEGDSAGRGRARRALVGRLVVEWEPPGQKPPDAVPAELEAAIGEALARADPDLDLGLDVTCPACSHTWATTLDVADFLWTEVLACARRVADEVAGLAAAYGWRESDILALSPWRRRLYLELATP